MSFKHWIEFIHNDIAFMFPFTDTHEHPHTPIHDVKWVDMMGTCVCMWLLVCICANGYIKMLKEF